MAEFAGIFERYGLVAMAECMREVAQLLFSEQNLPHAAADARDCHSEQSGRCAAECTRIPDLSFEGDRSLYVIAR